MEGNEDEQQYRESPQRGSSVADERQRDADDWHDAESHSDIDEKMHEDTAGDAVAIYSGECFPAFFCVFYYSPDKKYIQEDQGC